MDLVYRYAEGQSRRCAKPQATCRWHRGFFAFLGALKTAADINRILRAQNTPNGGSDGAVAEAPFEDAKRHRCRKRKSSRNRRRGAEP